MGDLPHAWPGLPRVFGGNLDERGAEPLVADRSLGDTVLRRRVLTTIAGREADLRCGFGSSIAGRGSHLAGAINRRRS